MINQVSKYVNSNIKDILLSQNEEILNTVYEIRIRINCPILLKSSAGDYFISYGKASKFYTDDFYKISKSDINSTTAALTSNSIHAYEKEIEKAFLTIEGGHRVGLSGDCLYEKNQFKGFKNISSFNIRIARDFVNCSSKIIKYIVKDSNSIYNTLIAGIPLSGKTTCIRDLARNLSDGLSNPQFKACDISVIDERGEIAAIHNGVPQFYLGSRTDILSYCMKKEGFSISIRSLAPKIIISDELGSVDDFDIVQYALKSGVSIISTAHASCVEDLFKNIYIKNILNSGFIERIIVLNDKTPVSIKQVYDNIKGRSIYDN
jgi:stage III sporulation protein AA